MKRFVSCIALVLSCLIVPTPSWSQSTQPAVDVEEDIIYRPPTASAGNARMGGGSRSDVKLPMVIALVPDHLGQSGVPQPVLYWFSSEATTLPREFSLVNATTLDTIKRVSMEAPIEAGWQKIDLAELGVTLERDVEYEWRIALVASTTNRSDNAVAGGMIKHVIAMLPAIEEPPLRHAARLAAAGLWYDAVHALMKQLPTDPAANVALAKLLEQVKLDEAAKFARK